MKIQTKRNGELIATSKVNVFIGDQEFSISESVDGNLVVLKVRSATTIGAINVIPCVSNQIEIG